MMKSINSMYKFFVSCLLVGVSVFIMISCDDSVLDEKVYDFLSTSNAFTTPDEVEVGVVGLYSLMRDWYSAIDEKYMFPYVSLGTDEAYYGEDPEGGYMCNWDVDIVPTSDLPQRYWTKAFDLVYQANTVLKGIEGVDWSGNEDLESQYIAEAKFTRAFSYRILVTLFGDVPYVTEPITTAKTDFTRASTDSIYDLMESDLQYAAANLPVPGDESEKGRLTQGAAWNLLSETYLAHDKYDSAVVAATHVIDDYGYSLMTERFGNQPDLFGSENCFFDLFTMDNHNLSSNTEAIWVIQNDPEITGGGEYVGERAFTSKYYKIGKTPDGFKAILGELYNGAYTGYSDTLGRGVAWNCPTNYMKYDIWKNDWDNDYRNSEACIKRNFYFDNSESAYDNMKIEWGLYDSRSSALKDTTMYLYPYWMKVATPCDHSTDEARSGGGYNYKDLYAMRLAETYLLRAEAYVDLGEPAKAAADINVVRERSNASDVTASDVDLDYILDERARELYTEEWRMITLMRMGKLVERVQKYNDDPENPGLGIQECNSLWPIPQDEIDLNTGAVLEQNPGYD